MSASACGLNPEHPPSTFLEDMISLDVIGSPTRRTLHPYRGTMRDSVHRDVVAQEYQLSITYGEKEQ